DTALGQVGGGEDGGDAGRLAGRADVDVRDARVRQRAAHDESVQRALGGEVIDVLTAPGEQRRVLAAGDRLSDEGHGRSSVACLPVAARARSRAVASARRARTSARWA